MGFKYDGLDRDSIRLLKPIRQKSKELSYEIVHVSLSSKPNYAALSYTWGLPGDTHHILLNGQVLPVRQNLHEALQQLQESKWVDKYLWVDAISINQGTNPDALQERSSQITLMKEIYEQAEKVLVWLGKPENENNNRLAFERIKYFKKIFMDSFKKGHPYRPWCKSAERSFERPANKIQGIRRNLVLMATTLQIPYLPSFQPKTRKSTMSLALTHTKPGWESSHSGSAPGGHAPGYSRRQQYQRTSRSFTSMDLECCLIRAK